MKLFQTLPSIARTSASKRELNLMLPNEILAMKADEERSPGVKLEFR